MQNEKAVKFLSLTRLPRQYILFSKKITDSLGKDRSILDHSIGGMSLEFQNKCYEILVKRSLEYASMKISNRFSDEELDELITMYSSPVISRLLDFLPVLDHEMSQFITDTDWLNEGVPYIIKEIRKDSEASNSPMDGK